MLLINKVFTRYRLNDRVTVIIETDEEKKDGKEKEYVGE